ncbi:MAG: cadherin-like domain-containing protein, partial [Candidatus Caenarcaniphilales bacterium]|nr:cadherin-like domain-containing protein [Candidatus Caenarcaniphilales bacterium]
MFPGRNTKETGWLITMEDREIVQSELDKQLIGGGFVETERETADLLVEQTGSLNVIQDQTIKYGDSEFENGLQNFQDRQPEQFSTGSSNNLSAPTSNRGLSLQDSQPENQEPLARENFNNLLAQDFRDFTIPFDGSAYPANAQSAGSSSPPIGNTLGSSISDTNPPTTLAAIIDEETEDIDNGGSSNSSPLALSDSGSNQEDSAITMSLLPNDSDPDGDTLTITSVTQGANGSVLINSDGTVTYTPNANFYGSDTFTYTISDGHGGTSTASVNVTIDPVDDLPEAVNDMTTTSENTPLIISVLNNDVEVDGDTLIITSVTQGANGTVTINGDGTVTYTPNANFFGPDSFTYTISDGQGGTSTATVNVATTEINDAPQAINDLTTTN